MIYTEDFIKQLPFLIGLYFTTKDIYKAKSDTRHLGSMICYLSIMIIIITCLSKKN